MSFADNALEFRSGNPRPAGTPDDILAQGMKFYSELSPETKEFFETMLLYELLDVHSDRGQAGGRLLHEHHGLSGAVHLRQLQRHAARRRRT